MSQRIERGEDAVPPTVKERSWRRIGCWLAAVGLLLLVAFGVGTYAYFKELRYQPTAHRHIPAGTTMVARADAEKIFLYKPVREHIWPALEEAGKKADRDTPATPESSPAAKKKRFERLEEETGVRFPLDLREVIVASVDGTSWVALVGGPFEKGRFVAGLHRVLQQDGVPGWSLADDLLVHGLGPTIGQAQDGTLILGTSQAIVRAALPLADHEAQVPLPIEGAASFLVNQQAWGSAVSLLPLSLPGLDTLANVAEARGSFILSEQPRLAVEIRPTPGTATDRLAADIERTLGALRTLTLLVPSDLAGTKGALREATVESRGAVVHVGAPWSYEAIDRALQQVGEMIRTGERPTSTPPSSRSGWWF